MPFVPAYGTKARGGFRLDKSGFSLDYIQNVRPGRLNMNSYRFEFRGGRLLVDGKKAMFVLGEPCKNCCQQCRIEKNNKYYEWESMTQAREELICERTAAEMVMNFETTAMYEEWSRKNNDPTAVEDKLGKTIDNHFIGQPNTLMGEMLNECDPDELPSEDFRKMSITIRRTNLVNLGREVVPATPYQKRILEKIKLEVGPKGNIFIPRSCCLELRQLVSSGGVEAALTWLVNKKIDRGINYYGPFGRSYLYREEGEACPEFMKELISYWADPVEQEQSMDNIWLISVLNECLTFMKAYYQSRIYDPSFSAPSEEDPVLLHLLQQREDSGPRMKPGVSDGYYYSAVHSYIAFRNFLRASLFIGTQKINPKLRIRSIKKIFQDTFEKRSQSLLKISDPPVMVDRIRMPVYDCPEEMDYYPVSLSTIEDFFPEDFEEDVSCATPEESELVFNQGLGTTTYGSYMLPGTNVVRGVICTNLEFDFKLINPVMHEYWKNLGGRTRGIPVSQLLAPVIDKNIGPLGEINSDGDYSDSYNFSISEIFETNKEVDASYKLLAYLDLKCNAQKYATKFLPEEEKKYSNWMNFALTGSQTSMVLESVINCLGPDFMPELNRIMIGKEEYLKLTEGVYNLGEFSMNPEVQAELKRINPSLIQMAIQGKLALKKKTKETYKRLFNNNLPENSLGNLFIHLLFNEINVDPNETMEANYTATMLTDLLGEILEWQESNNARENSTWVSLATLKSKKTTNFKIRI